MVTPTPSVSFRDLTYLEPIDNRHIESQIALLTKSYHGIPVDMTKYTLTKRSPFEFIDHVYEAFALRLFRNPRTHELAQFLVWFENQGDVAYSNVDAYIADQNEYKYITECLGHFQNLDLSSVTSIPTVSTSYPLIHYYGPIGTSGYAIACRDVVTSIGKLLGNQLMFIPYGVQNYGNSEDEDTKTLSYLVGSQTATPDIVIIHSIPDMWPQIVKYVKMQNMYARIIGVTVWETDAVPPQWEAVLRCVDEVWTPNAWNAAVFARDVPGLLTKCVPHPVLLPEVSQETETEAPLLTTIREHKENGKYIFYTVNEFSGRKGIDILIRTFLKTFKNTESVVLVIKTHGNVPEIVARQYIERHALPDSATILLDYTRWSDTDIHALHTLADCFVSFTRSEGHGLGACHAAAHGNHVIMTGYGGQLDYLTDIQWVPYSLIPATFCSEFDPAHIDCAGRPWCKNFPFFIPSLQKWGLVSDTDASAALRSAFDLRRTGSPTTVDFLKTNFSSAATGKNFVDAIQAAYEAPPHVNPQTTNDPYDLPDAVFAPQPTFKETPVRGARPRILFITCGGTGNYGDDSFIRIHKEEMEKDHDVYITHTNTYIDTTGKLRVLEDLGGEPMLFDHVIVGGGGIIHAGERKSGIFRVYLPLCKANNIPLSFLSVGMGEKELDPISRISWTEALTYAHLITVRSVEDAEAVKSLISRERHHRVKVAPDVVYKIAELGPLQKRYVVFVPTNFMSVQYQDVADLIRRRLWENPGSQLVFLPLNGQKEPKEYPEPFVKSEIARFRLLFPDAIIYTGRVINGPLRDLWPASSGAAGGSLSITMTLDDITNIFRRAAHVITGRFHGLVAAKAFGVPYDIGTANSAKLVQESESILDISTWKMHYTELRVAIKETVVPERIAKDPALWSEDERNTSIVDEVTQPKTGSWQSTIQYIQGLDNERLRERRIQALIA